MNGSAVFIIAFFTSAATAVASLFLVERLQLFEQPSDAAPEVARVPSLVGLTVADAETGVRGIGLELFVASKEERAQEKPNTVLRQAYPPGRELVLGSAISVVVSAALVDVPDVSGQSQASAEAKLKAAGLKGVVGEPMAHANLPVGEVASQSPEAGSGLAPETAVTLRLSSGPAEVEVPKVAGTSLSLAKKRLLDAGLEHKVRWVDLAETATYVVLRQDPVAGEMLKPGEAVTLVVNRE